MHTLRDVIFVPSLLGRECLKRFANLALTQSYHDVYEYAVIYDYFYSNLGAMYGLEGSSVIRGSSTLLPIKTTCYGAVLRTFRY